MSSPALLLPPTNVAIQTSRRKAQPEPGSAEHAGSRASAKPRNGSDQAGGGHEVMRSGAQSRCQGWGKAAIASQERGWERVSQSLKSPEVNSQRSREAPRGLGDLGSWGSAEGASVLPDQDDWCS